MKFIFFSIFSLFFTLLFCSQITYASNVTPNQYIVVFKDQNMNDLAKARIAETGELVKQACERLMTEVKQNQLLVQNRHGRRARRAQRNTTPNEMLAVYEHALKGFSATLTPAAVAYLKSKPEIAYIEADGIVTPSVVQVSPPSYGLDRVDQRNLPLDRSYTFNTDGSGVHLYVIDSGIRTTHTEFVGRIDNGFDFVDNDTNPSDCNGHGTHVTGTAAGTNHGIAKNVTIHPVRVFDCAGGASFSIIISAINWVINNLQLPAVTNMSLGGGRSTTIDTAVNNLINSGATVAVAAGNNGSNACAGSPARVANAITVASSTSTDQRSSFSNIGQCVDLFAPGSAIPSTWWTSDTATMILSGTSMSSPHVAGVAALYLQQNPTASPAQVANAIVSDSTANVVANAGVGTPNRLLYSVLTLTDAPPPVAVQPPPVAVQPPPVAVQPPPVAVIQPPPTVEEPPTQRRRHPRWRRHSR